MSGDSNRMIRPLFILTFLCAAIVLGTNATHAHDATTKPAKDSELRGGFAIPSAWTRRGVVLPRQRSDQGVSGDPCIVWDEAISGWRMVLFYDPPGHAQAICTNQADLGQGQWKLEGPLPVTNPGGGRIPQALHRDGPGPSESGREG
jgi:hypothetical protein